MTASTNTLSLELALRERMKRRERYKVPLVANPAIQQQAMMDNAPVGAVGAPGGLLQANSAPTGRDPVLGLLGTASYLPGIGGDVLGPAADLRMFQKQPESRTLGNAALFGLGLLPAIPSLAYMMGRKVEPGRMARMFPDQAGMTGYHGSPHKFDKFDSSKIGTGEGAQAYGHGLYIAENPSVAKEYAINLSNRDPANQSRLNAHANAKRLANLAGDPVYAADDIKFALEVNPDHPQKELLTDTLRFLESGDYQKTLNNTGALYHVDLPDEHIAKMLDWDKPLSEQPEGVKTALRKSPSAPDESVWPYWTGQQLYESEVRLGTEIDGIAKSTARKKMSDHLSNLGIPGIKYLDAGSRGAGDGTRNFVVFDDSILKILKRE